MASFFLGETADRSPPENSHPKLSSSQTIAAQGHHKTFMGSKAMAILKARKTVSRTKVGFAMGVLNKIIGKASKQNGGSAVFTQRRHVKVLLLMILAILCSHVSSAQKNMKWTWKNGNIGTNKSASYGTQGTASSSNKPGPRADGVTWTDSNGDLWLFGGHGKASSGTGYLSDLWKYDASTGNWTWVSGPNSKDNSGTYGTQGTASSSNIPGGRLDAAGWLDSSDDLWLFGGYGYDKDGSLGDMNDLWKYDVSANTWTWMKGASVYGTPSWTSGSSPGPGARKRSVAWRDNTGDLWLFGGFGTVFGAFGNRIGYLKDVWRYDVSAGTWSFQNGVLTINQSPVTSSPVSPGGLSGATGVALSDGDLLLFGGYGYSGSNIGRMNMLWRFDVANKTWSLLSGSNVLNPLAQKTGSSIRPGGLDNACGWLDASNNFWLYGGVDSLGTKSDVWKWSGSWSWMGDGAASHGTKGVFSLSNHPGPRYSAMSSQGSNGDLWLFGGSGLRNDLWKPVVLDAIGNQMGLTATLSNFQITSTESTGDALQDAGDIVVIVAQNGNTTTPTTNLPSGTNVVARWNQRWQVDFRDENSNGGILSMRFNIGSNINADRSYYLLHRTGTTGTFSLASTTDYELIGTTVKFWIDLDEVTSGDYYAIGWSDEGAGYALNFDNGGAALDKIELPIKLNASNSNFTAECWIKPSSIGSKQNLFDQKTGSGSGTPRALLRLHSDGKLNSWLGGSEVLSSQKLIANKWQHVALSYNGTTLKLYVDGSLDTSHSVTAEGCAEKWLFGCFRTEAFGFDGEVDELRIWDDERTEAELRSHMHKPLFGNESNLIAYYRFDQVSGSNLPDVSVNRENATLQDFALTGSVSNWVSSTAPVVAEAQINHIKGPGSCLVLDGSNDYVQVSNFLNPSSSNWTMEGWFNSNSLTSVMLSQLNGSGTGRQLMRLENGALKTSIDGVGTTGTTTVGTGEWHHYALTYDGTTVKMYLDGLLETSSTVSVTSATGNYQIGCNKTRTIFFEGKLDELRFWSAARTQAEIQDNMYTSVAEDATGLLAYYPCDHFNGTSLEDASSNTNTGTLKNFPWNCWTSAADREPFKTIKAGSHNTGSTWKDGTAPSSSTDQLAVFHDVTLGATGTYQKMQVNSGVTVTASADITVNGDVIVNGTLSGSNKLILGGSSKQCLGGSGSIGALQVNNSNDVSLEGDLTISGALTLSNGDIEVNNHTLTLSGTTSHGSATSYLKLNGTGNVKATVGSSPVILPIGRNPYLPVIIDDGGGAEYTVGVADKVYSNPTTQTTELTTHCVSETWTVQASQSVSNVSIQVGWDAAEEQTGFNRPKSAVAYWENGVGSAWTQGSTGAATGSDPYFRTIDMASMSTNLYYFGVGSGTSPLPVELTYFNAQWLEKGRSATLQWETASETDNSHFEIERSFDGVSFENIGRVEGQGNTITTTSYTFMDGRLEESPKLTVYYRLKQVDFNGEYAYSGVHALHVEGESISNVRLFPNPVNSTLYISSETEIGHINIYNSLGVRVQTAAYGSHTIDVSGLPAGQYFLEAIPVSGNERLPKHRFMVN